MSMHKSEVTKSDKKGPRPDLAGYLLKAQGAVWVYVVGPDGYLHLIPNEATFNNLFVSWDPIQNELTLDIPKGFELTPGAALLKSASDGKIYMESNKTAYYVPNLAKYHFNAAKASTVPQSVIDALKPGESWD